MSKKIVVAVIGAFQQGKSTLINGLLADSLSDVGKGLPTTHAIATYRHGPNKVSLYPVNSDAAIGKKLDVYKTEDHSTYENLGSVEFHLDKKALLDIDILDTPGINADDGKDSSSDTAQAKLAIAQADFLLVVVPNQQLDAVYLNLLRETDASGKPYSIIINCMVHSSETWSPDNNEDIRHNIEKQIRDFGGSPIPISGNQLTWPCNAAWFWLGSVAASGGPMTKEMESRKTTLTKNANYFFDEFLNKPAPNPHDLIELSRLKPVQDFLTGQGLTLRSVPTLLRLRQAWNEYRCRILGA